MASIAVEGKCLYNYLGKSGLRVSNVCLGGLNFGQSHYQTPGQLDEGATHDMINRFVQWGGNFIDTCGIYGQGDSERFIGSWLKGQERDRFVIATKVRFPTESNNPFGPGEARATNPNAVGLSRRHIITALDDSLQRLQTPYVDLLQTHAWDDAVPLEETLMTLNDVVRSGKVRYVGVSNVMGWQLQKIHDLSKQMGLNPVISLQQQYSLVSRSSELEVFQACRLLGVGVLAWSPLKGGFLTGKVKRDVKPTEGRLGWFADDKKYQLQSGPPWSILNTEKNWTILDTVERIAKAKGKTPAQVSLRWLLQKPMVSSVVTGATKLSQIDDSMGAANGWQLTPEEMRELDEASQPELPYPYDLIRKVNQSRINPWNPPCYV